MKFLQISGANDVNDKVLDQRAQVVGVRVKTTAGTFADLARIKVTLRRTLSDGTSETLIPGVALTTLLERTGHDEGAITQLADGYIIGSFILSEIGTIFLENGQLILSVTGTAAADDISFYGIEGDGFTDYCSKWSQVLVQGSVEKSIIVRSSHTVVLPNSITSLTLNREDGRSVVLSEKELEMIAVAADSAVYISGGSISNVGFINLFILSLVDVVSISVSYPSDTVVYLISEV